MTRGLYRLVFVVLRSAEGTVTWLDKRTGVDLRPPRPIWARER